MKTQNRRLNRILRRVRGHYGSNALHPFLGFVRQPHAKALSAEPVHPQARMLGFPFNDQPLLQRASPDRLVVGLFGGSVANILGITSSAQLRQRLAEIPRFAGREVVLLNFGLGGYKQPQQLMVLNYFLALGGHFDLVINIDGFNEVALPPAELDPRGVAPFYPRDWFYRVSGLNSELRLTMGEVAFLRQRRVERAERLEQSRLRWSSLIHLLWQARDGQDNKRLGALQKALLETARDAKDFQTRGPHWKYPNPQAQAQGLAEIWVRSSWQMAQLCRARGIEYYHFLQPNQYVEGSKVLSEEEKRIAFDAEVKTRQGVLDGYPALLAAGRREAAEGLPFWDLTQIFRTVSDTLYLDTCCHFNGQGNVILAQNILRIIEANPGPPPLHAGLQDDE